MSSVASFVLSAWFLVACSAGSPPYARSETDPSNPNAPAGPPVTLASAPVSVASAHAGHDHVHEPSAKGEYTCPMHPEVSASGPGHCPTCHMDLVPKK